MEQKFNVKGMTCAVCQATIEKDVSKMEGVNKVSVSLLTNTMLVDFDTVMNNPNKIMKQVKKSGYSASILSTSEESTPNLLMQEELKEMKRRVIVSFLFFVPLIYLSMGPMIGLPIPNIFIGLNNSLLYALIQLIFVLPIVFINYKYFKVGILHLVHLKPNMDTLVALGSIASLTYSLIQTVTIAYGQSIGDSLMIEHASMNLYFEAAGSILTLVTVGKFLEALSKGQTKTELEKLMKLQPKMAFKIEEDEIIQISVEEIQEGDHLLVKPGMQIPVDGIIIEGNSAIDESMISGESIPVDKYVGDRVISATINQSGRIVMKAEKVGNATTLNQIIELVEKASMTKAPIQRLADTISLYFVPFVILISIISFSAWLIQGESFSFALSMGITVLVISCPCALGLATPVAMMVGTGKGAQYGVLYKTAEAIQKCEKINTIILDKTGTITLGKPMVTDMIKLEKNLKYFDEIIFSLEENSSHPLAQAMIKYYQSLSVTGIKMNQITETPGFGMTGNFEGIAYFVGNKRWLDSFGIHLNENQEEVMSLEKSGKTLIYFFTETKVLGVIALRDEIKPSSRVAIEKMKKHFDQVIMLTGDNEQSAMYWKEELDIEKVYYQVLPNEKDAIIKKYIDEGKKVAMIGDGINDSIALVRADVGISLGTGSDIAKSAADVLLIKDDLMDAFFALTLSKKTMNNVRMNLFFAFIYNVVLIPVAAGLFFTNFGLKLNPVYGSFAMSLSSVTVVLNALRLKLIKPNKGELK